MSFTAIVIPEDTQRPIVTVELDHFRQVEKLLGGRVEAHKPDGDALFYVHQNSPFYGGLNRRAQDYVFNESEAAAYMRRTGDLSREDLTGDVVVVGAAIDECDSAPGRLVKHLDAQPSSYSAALLDSPAHHRGYHF